MFAYIYIYIYIAHTYTKRRDQMHNPAAHTNLVILQNAQPATCSSTGKLKHAVAINVGVTGKGGVNIKWRSTMYTNPQCR